MLDLQFIGREGLIIDYTDIVSMIGFNIAKYIRSKNTCKKLDRMSIEDILLSYINRSTEDISEWLRTFDIEIDLDELHESISAHEPNLMYAYKLFDSSYKNGIKNLGVYLPYESNTVNQLLKAFTVPIKVYTGNIVDVLNNNPNVTFTSASPKLINGCLNVKAPFMLVICDDFLYTSSVISDKIDDRLRKDNKIVAYTSILSAGLT